MCCTLKSFCGMRLSTAGLAIGWISFAISLIEAIAAIVVISCIDTIMGMNYSTSSLSYRQEPLIASAISAGIAVQLGASLLDLISSILLILGTIKRVHLMLLPWLLHNGAALVIRFLMITIGLIVMLSTYGIPFFVWLGLSLILGIWAWPWLAVHSLYKTIRNERDASNVDYELLSKNANTAESGNGHDTLISVNHLLRNQI